MTHVYVGVLEIHDKNSSTNSLASPIKYLEFNRSPKQALSVRDENKPRTSRSTLPICGTPYFSGSYSPSTGFSLRGSFFGPPS